MIPMMDRTGDRWELVKASGNADLPNPAWEIRSPLQASGCPFGSCCAKWGAEGTEVETRRRIRMISERFAGGIEP